MNIAGESFKGLAFDIGASHGRSIVGLLQDGVITLEEVHEFANEPLERNGEIRWDFKSLCVELIKGLVACGAAGHRNIDSIAVDTWGIDFGLVDDQRELLDFPRHYRDPYSHNAFKEIFEIIPAFELFKLTGMQNTSFNTIFQLYGLVKERPDIAMKARNILFVPDLFNHLLTGEASTEYSIAGTSQLLRIEDRKPCSEIFSALGLSVELVPEILQCGSVVGRLKKSIADAAGIGQIPIMAVAEHDTQSAIAAIPSDTEGHAYISCGTWSIMGIEAKSPIVNKEAMSAGFSNEIGLPGFVCFSKLIPGLWIIQECLADWRRSSQAIDYSTMDSLIRQAKPFATFLDSENEFFLAPGGMPERIKAYCAESSQLIPNSIGAIARCVIESLAMSYRKTFDDLERVIRRSVPIVHIVGGGAKNKTFCQMAANAMGKKVIAGPVEATAIGNLLQQAIACGKLANLDEARSVVRRSFALECYEPIRKKEWDDAYFRYREAIARSGAS
jgi:rhamnulokinase